MPNFYDREQLRQLASAPPVRNFLRQHGIVRAPGLNLFDSAKLQAGREAHWDTIADAADADRETYKQLLRGLANTSGMQRGRQFERAIDAGSQQIKRLAPYLMTTAPNLWDQAHGNRGSAASLASAVAQAHPDRTPLENSAVAQTVFKKMPQNFGMAAKDLGVVYKTMADQGLLGQKGGLEANEAANRVLHVGSGLRGLIDANREFPKRAAAVSDILKTFGLGNLAGVKPNKPADKVIPPMDPNTVLPHRKPPTGVPRVVFDAAAGPEPIHSATTSTGRWRGFHHYNPQELLRHYQTPDYLGPVSGFIDPPKKTQLALEMQNPFYAAEARKKFEQQGGLPAALRGCGMIPILLQKAADLKPEVTLQPHQEEIEGLAKDHPLRMLLVHAMGSGKSLSGIAASEARGEPYTAIAPASLRENYKKEISRFTDGQVPSDVMSYSALAAGKLPEKGQSLILDESQNLRNMNSARTQEAILAADRAKQVMMLSATPIVNHPSELAVPLRILTGEEITPEAFERRYVTTKTKYPSLFHRILGWKGKQELDVAHEKELKKKLKGHVHYYDPGKPVVPTTHEDIPVTMSPEQAMMHAGMYDRLPWWAKYKLKNEIALTEDEFRRLTAFLTGPRQVGLSTYPYQKNPDAYKAFQQSPKLQEAMKHMLAHLKDPRAKGIAFANFIDAGLTPYAAGLAKAKVPAAVFHGGLSDKERKALVEDYNRGKLRVALFGPSGTEGLSLKGTGLSQLLDPHFQGVRSRQAIGRGLRFDSHTDLPEDMQNMKVQRFFSRLPMGLKDRTLSRLGFDRTKSTLATDDHLARISADKERLNARFMALLREVGETK